MRKQKKMTSVNWDEPTFFLNQLFLKRLNGQHLFQNFESYCICVY